MINGAPGHALDCDDILDIMPGHPGVAILSALLATLHGHTITMGHHSLWHFTGEAVSHPRTDASHRGARRRDQRSRRSAAAKAAPPAPGVLSTSKPAPRMARFLSVQVRVSPGYPSRGLTSRDIEHKFRDCATHGGLKTEQARRASDALAAVERADDVNAVVRLMTLA